MATRLQKLAPPQQHQSRDWLLKGTLKSPVEVNFHMSEWVKASGIRVTDLLRWEDSHQGVSAKGYPKAQQSSYNGRESHPWQVGNYFNFLSGHVEQKIPGLKPSGGSTIGSSTMDWMKRPSHLTRLAVALGLGLVVNVPAGIHFAELAQAQIPASPLNRSLPDSWNFDPPKRGNPGGTEGGATRGPDCGIPAGKQLTVLGPKSFGEKEGVSFTSAAYPTLYWYLPQSAAKKLKFVLTDKEQDKVIYKVDFDITEKSGIVSLKIPPFATASPLEVGKEYLWQLTLDCPSNKGPEPEPPFGSVAEGLVRRVAPDPVLALQLQKATPEQRVTLYAKARLWHETLATLAELRRSRPGDRTLAAAWEKLLNSAGLSTVSKEPMLQSSASSAELR